MYHFSPHINENVQFFKKLAFIRSDKKKNDLLKEATADQILGLVEICANILKFNFQLNKRQKRRLCKYADYYRAIARARTKKTARKRPGKRNSSGCNSCTCAQRTCFTFDSKNYFITKQPPENIIQNETHQKDGYGTRE